MHPAARAAIVEHRLWRVADPLGVDVGVAAEDVVRVEPDALHDRCGLENLRIVERDLVVDPLLVHLDGCGSQQDILEPVRSHPTGCIAMFDADAPGLAAVGDDLVAQSDQLIPGFWNLVACVGKRLNGIPNERLGVALEVDAVHVAVVRGLVGPCRAVVRCDLVGVDPLAQIHEIALLGERVHETGLGDLGDIRRVATFDPDRQHGLIVGDAVVLDVDSGPGRKVGEGVCE